MEPNETDINSVNLFVQDGSSFLPFLSFTLVEILLPPRRSFLPPTPPITVSRSQ